MSGTTETFQISAEAAEAYESRFVPAIFADWAPHMVDAAGVASGQRVLDVACGTGIVARTAADRLGGQSAVVGLDLNEAMLSVARRLRPDIEWRQGDACALPFPDDSFDTVLCQSALMFFPDRAGALREMARAVTRGGRVAVQVWASLDAQPAYGRLVDVAARHAGPDAVHLLGAYWVLGNLDGLGALFEEAGLRIAETRTRTGTARFDSIDAMVRTEVESTPLIERIDQEIYARIRADAREALGEFQTEAGTVEAPIAGHIVIART